MKTEIFYVKVVKIVTKSILRMRRSRRLLCVNCEDCVNFDGCWCLLDERDVKNHFSYIDDMKYMRNESLTEEDKKDLQECLDFTDYYLGIKQPFG